MNTHTNTILKWLVIIGLFAVPFIPFIVSSTMLFPFISGKGFAFRILVEVIAGLYILLALSDVMYRPKLSLISKSVLVFIGIILLADLFGKYPYKSLWSNYERMEGFVTMAHLALYYFVLSGMLHTELWWKRFWNTTLFASGIMTIYGFLQLAHKIPINQGGVRLDATFGNSAYLGIYAVFHIFIALILLLKEKRLGLRIAYGVLAFSEFIILYYTATRGAILGFIGGIIISGLLIAWKEKNNKHVRTLAKGFIGIVVVVLIGFYAVRNTSFVQKSPVLSRFASMSLSEAQSQGRYYVWPMALKGFAERPLLGWGQENFNYVFNKYYNPAMYNQEQWFDRAHDVVLDWLIAGGVLGFLSYLGMFMALMYFMWKKAELSVEEKSLLTGLIAAYIFHNLFVFDNLISYILFFTVLAYVHGRTVHQPIWSRLFERTFSKDALTYIALPLVVLGTAVGMYVINVPAIVTAQTLIQSITFTQGKDPAQNLQQFKDLFAQHSFGSSEALEQLVSDTAQIMAAQQVKNEVKQGFFELTDRQIKIKITQTPEDARYLLFAGSFYNHFASYSTALPYLQKAVEFSPGKPAMYFELGNTYIGMKDYPKALDAMGIGYNLVPVYTEGQINYAVAALYNNRPDIADPLLAALDKNTYISDNRIVRAYLDTKNNDKVESILQARVNSSPSDAQNQLTLASFYVQIGQKAKAIAIIQQVDDAHPEFKAQGESYIKSLQ